MKEPMTEVTLDTFAAMVREQMSNVDAGKIDEINECLRLRERAMGLEASLKAPIPSF